MSEQEPAKKPTSAPAVSQVAPSRSGTPSSGVEQEPGRDDKVVKAVLKETKWVEIAMLVVTTVSVIAAIFQGCMAKRAVEEASRATDLANQSSEAATKASEASTKEAARAADAAIKTANDTAASFKLHDRPWMTPTTFLNDINIPKKVEHNGFMVRLPFKNVGTVPAQHFTQSVRNAWSRDGHLPPDYQQSMAKEQRDPSDAMVGAGETLLVAVGRKGVVNEHDLNVMNGTDMRWYVWGTLYYDGPGSVPGLHGETDFCMFWMPHQGVISPCEKGTELR